MYIFHQCRKMFVLAIFYIIQDSGENYFLDLCTSSFTIHSSSNSCSTRQDWITLSWGYSMILQLLYSYIIQRKLQNVLDKVMLYSIATICQFYGKCMNFRVDQLQHVHRPQSTVYKIDQFVIETLSSFPNIRFLS